MIGRRFTVQVSSARAVLFTTDLDLRAFRKRWERSGYPLVSCVMLTRREVGCFDRAVRTLARQTYPNWELIVVGRENLRNHISSIASLKGRIKFVPDTDDRSFDELLRSGVAAARGDFACRWDDDDVMDAEKIEVQAAAMDALGVDACILLRHLLSDRQGGTSVSKLRAWPSSMMWKASAIPSVSLDDGGVGLATRLMNQERVALLEAPHLYTTVCDGRNRFLTEEALSRFSDGAAETVFEEVTSPGPRSVGLVVTTYNRPEYVSRCLRSLSSSRLEDAVVAIVDDASSDERTKQLIREFRLRGAPVVKIFKRFRRGFDVHGSLRIGWDHLIERYGCRLLCNLDSDAVVNSEWLTRIRALHERHGREDVSKIVTGFNAHTHPSIGDGTDFHVKKSIGGINMFFTRNVYRSIVRPILERRYSNWDWDTVRAMEKCGGVLLCTKPSVIQHIGEWGTWSNGVEFDRARDYVEC